MPDVPVKVEYDEQLKLYLYSAHLVSKQPFANEEDKIIASNIIKLLSCSIYRLYIFEHKNKDPELMQDCIGKIMYQMMSKEQREISREKERQTNEDFAPLFKEAERQDKERAKKTLSTKPKTKKTK